MDEKHPSHADPRPKRRKDKDNPYEIFTTGAGTSLVRYYIRFKDGTAPNSVWRSKRICLICWTDLNWTILGI
jgi:hypothetical protein